MADDKEKPIAFKAGAITLSAGALNKILEAIPRMIKGGPGISIEKFGDRIIIRLADSQGAAPGDIALAVVTDVSNGTYLVCDKDGATINVAKPWALRMGVDWPTGPAYTYSDPNTRTAVGGTTETQDITPDYQVGEELLVARLPSARINDAGGNMIVWYDMNSAGRSWDSE